MKNIVSLGKSSEETVSGGDIFIIDGDYWIMGAGVIVRLRDGFTSAGGSLYAKATPDRRVYNGREIVIRVGVGE